MGLTNRCGQIKKGYKADFIVLDKDLDLRATYLGGQEAGKRNRLKVEFTVVDSAFLIFTSTLNYICAKIAGKERNPHGVS